MTKNKKSKVKFDENTGSILNLRKMLKANMDLSAAVLVLMAALLVESNIAR